MSRYQQRIFINNPEKIVPDDLVEQFFLVLKSADLDKIRQFVVDNKIKYNLVEKLAKNNPSDTHDTPFHTILELDDKVADNSTKLSILKFLEQMGAPIDLPDSADVWPIHLAAASQSKKITDFLIKKKVRLDRKDSSNNTPLHYAVYGRSVDCPSNLKIGDLVPVPDINKKSLNKSLENANNLLIKLLNNNEPIKNLATINSVNDDLIHMVNTIQKLPQMYLNDKLDQSLKNSVINIFSDVANKPSFASDNTNGTGSAITNGMTIQQEKLEQLIRNTYNTITEDLFRAAISPISIGPGKGGWGPQIPIDAVNSREPDSTERIMEFDIINLRKEIETEFNNSRKNLISVNTTNIDTLVRTDIPKFRNKIIGYLDRLVFNEGAPNPNLGEEVTLMKILCLLILNSGRINYSDKLADEILSNYKIMDNGVFGQIMNGRSFPKKFASGPIPGHILFSPLADLIDSLPNSDVKINIYSKLATLDRTNNPNTHIVGRFSPDGPREMGCISKKLLGFFTISSDPSAINTYTNTLIGKTSITNLLKKDYYRPFLNEFNTLNAPYNNGSLKWFNHLKNFIISIKPIAAKAEDNIFSIMGNPVFPQTPLPNSGLLGLQATLKNKFTYHELFRIMQMLEDFITTNNFQATKYPNIYKVNINEWLLYVNSLEFKRVYRTLGNGTIKQIFPEFIFLYRILVVSAIRSMTNVIKECIDELSEKIPFATTDGTLLELIYPSSPYSNIFAQIKGPLDDLRKNVWDGVDKNSLMAWFKNFNSIIPIDFYSKVFDSIKIGIPPTLAELDVDILRQNIETIVEENFDTFREIVTDPKFRTVVKGYLGTGATTSVPSSNIRMIFFDLLPDVVLGDQFYSNLDNLRSNPKKISELFFLTETYGYLYARIAQLIFEINTSITSISRIISDILSFINNRIIYYIPQIFLPAMIKQLLIIVQNIIDINDLISIFKQRITEFYPSINFGDNLNNNIYNQGNEFIAEIEKQTSKFYSDVINIVKYHNDVIDFLNTNSAYRLINSTRIGNTSQTNRMFDFNLVPFEEFPNITDTNNWRLLLDSTRTYAIPKTRYYADSSEDLRTRYDRFNLENTGANNFVFNNYWSVINYIRSGLVSNSPIAGSNSQLNIEIVNDGTSAPNLIIHEILNPIDGQWLNFNGTNIHNITYLDAFIAYHNDYYRYQWLNGMAPSIRTFVGPHFQILKQKIIQDVIQAILDNNQLDLSDPNRNENLAKMYSDLKNLGTETTHTAVSDVKVYVIIGKLLDDMINKILEYSIRQSISNWIYSYSTNDPSYRNMADSIRKTLDIVAEKNYLRLSPSNININSIESSLRTDPRFVDYLLPQVETNPLVQKYVSKPTNTEFIHYLYDINYFSESNINSNKECYQVKPDLVEKFITADTINAKNSDGNTPLSIAVQMYYSDIVELLVGRGAKAKSFSNLTGRTPADTAIENAIKHANFTNGRDKENKVSATVFDTISNFVYPFNNLLMARLLDDRFNNNVTKNISLGIPVQLVMFNHMFHLYLENYRFGFSIELKNDIRSIIKKYYNQTETIFPIDLFEVDNDQQLMSIVEPASSTSRSISAASKLNSRKINSQRKEIDQLSNQIDSLQKEKTTTTDPNQIQFIDQIISRLENSRNRSEAKISSMQISTQPREGTIMISIYESMLNSIKSGIIDRSFDLLSFYDYAFNKIGKTPDVYLGVWNNYLGRNLFNTPSMIFSVISEIIFRIIESGQASGFSSEIKSDLGKISEFYSVVKSYIESKNLYPKNLQDNPVYSEEFDQLAYLLNLIITPPMLNIVMGHFYQGLREMDPANTIIDNEVKIYKELSDISFNGQTIESFMKDILPKIMIKYVTGIYYNEADYDRRISNANDIFLPLIQMIKSNRIIQVTDDSVLVTNFKEYLIPFMVNTYSNFIHHTRLATYGYERYLLNTYDIIRILKLVV